MGSRALGALALAGALAVATPAQAAPPAAGAFVLGKSLGGVRLGMTKAEVSRVWGIRHGVCRECRRTTWYFNYRPFEPEGAGVVFQRGRVVHAFTVWKPMGWRTRERLALGADLAEITLTYGALTRRQCAGYSALVAPAPGAQNVFYVNGRELWGFGLTLPDASPCL